MPRPSPIQGFFIFEMYSKIFWTDMIFVQNFTLVCMTHIPAPKPTAVWSRIEMCRDFFVKASLTFFDQIILPIRNQMVEKV